MTDNRGSNARRNVLASLCAQIVGAVCGLITPRLLIGAYGSEAYGVTTSILNFLAYIALLEGGVGGVVRSVLYGPLAQDNRERVAQILKETERFFRILAGILVIYVLVLALGFHKIARVTCLDWFSTFLLVLIIGVSTFGEYFFGMSHTILLNASQRSYVTESVTIGTYVINALSVIMLVLSGCSLLTVKLVSSLVYLAKPLALRYFRGKVYPLPAAVQRDPQALRDKWVGMSQHIAYFLHNNTDVVVLTLLADLKLVAVYAVYNMVLRQIGNVVNSFCAGMEALFGDMLAKRETENLNRAVLFYETLISSVTVILLAATAVLIVPFVGIYTRNIHDVDYIRPVFSLLMCCAVLVECLRLPYHNLIIAAGRFRQTQGAAYSEAILNILLSVILVRIMALPGVEIGTLVAVGFRYGYYVIYLSRHILHRSPWIAFKRLAVNAVSFALVFLPGMKLMNSFPTANYGEWIIAGFAVVGVAVVVNFGMNMLFFKEQTVQLLRGITRKMSIF